MLICAIEQDIKVLILHESQAAHVVMGVVCVQEDVLGESVRYQESKGKCTLHLLACMKTSWDIIEVVFEQFSWDTLYRLLCTVYSNSSIIENKNAYRGCVCLCTGITGDQMHKCSNTSKFTLCVYFLGPHDETSL